MQEKLNLEAAAMSARTAAAWDDIIADLRARKDQRDVDDQIVDAEVDALSLKAHLGDRLCT